MFKVLNGQIYMGETLFFGHCCNSIEEMENYCSVLNEALDPEDAKIAKRNDELISQMSIKNRQEIIDILENDTDEISYETNIGKLSDLSEESRNEIIAILSK